MVAIVEDTDYIGRQLANKDIYKVAVDYHFDERLESVTQLKDHLEAMEDLNYLSYIKRIYEATLYIYEGLM